VNERTAKETLEKAVADEKSKQKDVETRRAKWRDEALKKIDDAAAVPAAAATVAEQPQV
jgi:hypothetical protein